MTEFEKRVDAQRKLLQVVNSGFKSNEKLFALTDGAINRWLLANAVDPRSPIAKLLKEASERIFAMANHSDDPVCGAYRLSARDLAEIGNQVAQCLPKAA